MQIRLPRSLCRLRTAPRGRWLAGVAAFAVLAGAGTWTAVADDGPPAVHREDRVQDVSGAQIDTSYFTAGGDGRRPAVLIGHGFGGSKEDVRAQAEKLAQDGYAVLTWSARGFGKSTGRIGINDPKAEVKDVSRLIDWLARRPEVLLDGKGDPRVGITGSSYGGAISLLGAGHDRRVDAIAPQITYWNLADALFPDGVFKKLWAGIFFSTGSFPGGSAPSADQPATPPAGDAPTGDAPAGDEAGGEEAGRDKPGAEDDRADEAGRDKAGRDKAGGDKAGADKTGGDEAGAGEERAARDAPSDDRAGSADGTAADRLNPSGCGRFEARLCAMYERVAVAGKPDAEARTLLQARSPSAVADRIEVPALIVQGQSDSLFPLSHADAMAKAVAGNGAPVAVDWIAGGHDGGDRETSRVQARIGDWFDRYLKQDKGVDTGPAFRVSRTGGVDSTDGQALLRGATADRYPGLTSGTRAFPLAGGEQRFANPAGATPPAISAVPGLGGGAGALSSLGVGLSLDFPGQFASFTSTPLDRATRITGSPVVTVEVASDRGDAVLFGKVYDVGPDGRQQVLPAQLVAPVRVEDATAERKVTLTLPAVDHEVDAGHRLRLVLSATDLGYASPAEPAMYTVSLAGALTVPTAPAVRTQDAALPWWVWGLPAAGALVAAALLIIARRRAVAPAPAPERADVPLEITGLTKRYAKSADRYAVRDLSFRVEKGQVLGLLGPNGAGKTTTLRMLMGLIRPDAGEIRVFGHAIRPGAPVLSRVGAFVEGAGFLPHLSGRENLELYWQATGRPAADAHIEEALEIAGLGDALARAVRTYSQGMRQRLAIAQAMLGLPDLLILDEPTNGLDPPQIREMRDVMIRYAAGGRTVIVSSHLLSEVEQTCTHLVVMDRGRLVQAGPVAEITGESDTLLVTTARKVPEPVVEKIAALPGIGSAVRTEEGLLVRLDGADATVMIAELVRLDVPLTGVGPHRRLEDAFLTLIGGSA
ncbi:alpha/beta fold hydrolase [Streptomyces sp. ISL-10]|uniref:alpha/beta fold hydrolase n=1 Tax=Streptomyces sp. ISL-10 TaxID=2819172 RepID=UPI001BE52237|nr:alpha/beta fold hydrolase [Streptomyces sp. ISL-10]MBT2368445.1 alpha/beta fold hydrolase [Streptomyces sp. ISL-10]